MNIYICVYVYAYIYIHIYIYVCVYTYVNIHIYTYKRLHIHAYTYTYVHACKIYVCTCINIYMNVVKSMCTQIEWRRVIGCLIFIGHFSQKSPIISACLAKKEWDSEWRIETYQFLNVARHLQYIIYIYKYTCMNTYTFILMHTCMHTYTFYIYVYTYI